MASEDADADADASTAEAPRLKERTTKFLSNLHGYLDTQKQLNAKYKEEDPDELLANYDVIGDDERTNKPVYTKELQQQSITGEPVKNIEELYEAAALAKPVYERIVQKIVDQVHASRENDNDNLDDAYGVRELAPLKGEARSQEKANDDYASRVPGPGVSWLFDIVRGSIKWTSTRELLKCMELLNNPEDETEFRLVKAKNRFKNPTLSGYRDFNVCIQITVPNGSGGSFQHICELQIHHIRIKSLSEVLHSHQYYEFFRSFFDGATESLGVVMNMMDYLSGFERFDFEYIASIIAMANTSVDEANLINSVQFFNDFLQEPELALIAAERLLEIRQSRPHEENDNPGTGFFMLAKVHHESNPAKALEYYGKSIEIQDPNADAIGFTYCMMGDIYDRQLGKPEEAFDLFEKAEKGIIDQAGPEDKTLIQVYMSMAGVHFKRGDYDKAVQKCEKAHVLTEKHFGPEYWYTGIIDGKLAESRRNQGRFEEAVELCKKAQKTLLMAVGAHHTVATEMGKQLADTEAEMKLAKDALA